MTDKRLIEAAVIAHDRAYAPYSNYPVGAAVRDEYGKIHAGCNAENAAYCGIHAEVGAVATMIAAGGRRIIEVAVVRSGIQSGMPCGDCRQMLREFAALDCPVHICDEKGSLRESVTLGELLPMSFGPEHIFGNKK